MITFKVYLIVIIIILIRRLDSKCTTDIDVIKTFISRQIPDIIFILSTVGGAIYQMIYINEKLMWVSNDYYAGNVPFFILLF